MKTANTALLSVVLAVSLPVLAPAADTYAAKGTVNTVDVATGKANITHEPVPALNWPGMTMGFVVRDAGGLKQLKPGDRVDFLMVKEGYSYVITKITHAKE